MTAIDVQELLDLVIVKSVSEQVKVMHCPRLISDNGPCYFSGHLQKCPKDKNIKHIGGRPCHPMPWGKIERFNRLMKNVINLEKCYIPWELEKQIEEFVNHYNHERYHESLNDMTHADVNAGRSKNIL